MAEDPPVGGSARPASPALNMELRDASIFREGGGFMLVLSQPAFSSIDFYSTTPTCRGGGLCKTGP